MKAYNKLFLDTNRHHLKTIAQGTIRGLQLPAAERIMREEFRPDYPLFAHDYFEDIVAFMQALYKCYDQWLKDNPNWHPEVTRYGMREESISFLEAYRPALNDLVKQGSCRGGADVEGLLRVMLIEFNPAYQLNVDDPQQPGKMVQDIYKLFDERKAAEQPAPATPEKRGPGRPRTAK